MSILPNWFIDLMKFQSKSWQVFWTGINKLVLKFLWKDKGTRIAKKTEIEE